MELSTVIAGIETAILAAPSLGVRLGDSIQGEQPQQRRHLGVWVERESTVNLDQTRNHVRSRVEDTIKIELSYRVSPKNQRAGRNAAYDLAKDIRNRITDRGNATLAPFQVVYLDEIEDLNGEWLIIQGRYTTRRYAEVGAG